LKAVVAYSASREQCHDWKTLVLKAAVAYSASREQAARELINLKANPMKAETEERNLTSGWTLVAPRFFVCFFDRPAISFAK